MYINVSKLDYISQLLHRQKDYPHPLLPGLNVCLNIHAINLRYVFDQHQLLLVLCMEALESAKRKINMHFERYQPWVLLKSNSNSIFVYRWIATYVIIPYSTGC